MGRVAEKLRGVTCGTDAAPPPPPNPDPWVRGHPFGDFISSSLVRGPAFLNPLVVAPFSLLLQISTGWSFSNHLSDSQNSSAQTNVFFTK